MNQKDRNRYSLSRVLRSMDRREKLDGLELEMHDELSKKKLGNHSVEGVAIPFDVLGPRHTRDLSVGVFGQGGGTVQTSVPGTVIPVLRNKICAVRLGATVLTGLTSNLALPRQTGTTTTYSLPESATLTKSTPNFDQLVLSPHRIGATIDYSRQLILQSSVAVEDWLREDVLAQVGIKIDYLLMNGQGAGSEPLGVLNWPGIGSVNFGATATWTKILAFENALALANADVPGARLGWVTSPSTRNAWKSIAKTGTGVTSVVPIFLWSDEIDPWHDGSNDGAVNSYRAATTNQVINNSVTFGDWKELILGMWGSGLDLLVNPYSRDTDAVVRLTANAFVDVGIRHAQSFCVSSDAGNQ
jgi:hypothetical protein